METAIAKSDNNAAAVMEKVLIHGDLGKLSEQDRVMYYHATCQSLGLNELTRPFEYIVLNGKLTLYARKDCTEQLRNLKNVSVQILSTEVVEGVYIVRAKATMGNRFDESIGAVNIEGLKADAKANAIMKAETKAKRRVTLSICGLGMLDETEVETIREGESVVEKPVKDAWEAGREKAAQVKAEQQPLEAQPTKETGELATQNQVKAIYAINKSILGITSKETDEKTKRLYGRVPEELTKAEASEIIKSLQENKPNE